MIPDLPVSHRFLLRPAPAGDGRHSSAVDLLAGRSGSVADVLEWAKSGQVYVLHDPAAPASAGAAAAVLILPVGSGATAEIRLMEIAPRWQESDVGLRLLMELADALRSRGVHKEVAGVGIAELDRVDLLTRAGFRMAYVERDSRPPGRSWSGAGDGVANRDVLWLELDL